MSKSLNRFDDNLKIHIIAVAYKKIGEMRVFVQSLLNQTNNNWILSVIHDGPSDEFESVMSDFSRVAHDRIEYFVTEKRYNDYGHSLREMALKNTKGDYILLTNADN